MVDTYYGTILNYHNDNLIIINNYGYNFNFFDDDLINSDALMGLSSHLIENKNNS